MTSRFTDRQREAGRRFLDRLIGVLATIVVLTIVGFAAFYVEDQYLDWPGNQEAGPLKLSIERYEQAVRDDPQDMGARLALGELYYAEERYSESAQQYGAALTIDHESPLAMVGLGRTLLALGDHRGAIDNLQQVIDLAADADIAGDLVEAAHYYMASVLLIQERPGDAISHLNEALAIERADADAWHLLGAAHIENGDPEEAIAALSQAVSFVPDFTEAYEKLVIAYELASLAPESQYARGMVAFTQGQYAEAEENLTAALDASPTLVEAYIGLGLVQESQGQRDLAVSTYQQALDLDPENFNVWAGLARLGVPPHENGPEQAVNP